jgi:hypothetical protein
MEPGTWLQLINERFGALVDHFIDSVVRFFRFELMVSRVNIFLDVTRG